MNILNMLFGAGLPQIDAAGVQAKLREQPRPFVLDVRQPEEYRAGHIPGAALIPLGELRRRAGELPKDREIICVCASGSRSSSATRELGAAGFRATNMSGGMHAWGRSGLPVKKGASK